MILHAIYGDSIESIIFQVFLSYIANNATNYSRTWFTNLNNKLWTVIAMLGFRVVRSMM
jgi:hypothetical protein